MNPTATPLATALPPARCARDERLAAHLADAAAGDARAYEAFYDATVGHARALARRMLKGADVDDLLADAYFEAWRHAARFDAARGSAVTWLLMRVRSRALDRLRQLASQAAAAQAEPDGDCAADPAEHLWQAQAGSRLDAALRQLSPTERWVLGLAFWRELSHRQIAQATGLPLGTVKTSVQRAQARLRLALAANGDAKDRS